MALLNYRQKKSTRYKIQSTFKLEVQYNIEMLSPCFLVCHATNSLSMEFTLNRQRDVFCYRFQWPLTPTTTNETHKMRIRFMRNWAAQEIRKSHSHWSYTNGNCTTKSYNNHSNSIKKMGAKPVRDEEASCNRIIKTENWLKFM